MAPRRRSTKKQSTAPHSINLRSRAKEQHSSEAPSPKSRAPKREPARAQRKNSEPKHCPICVDAEDFKLYRKSPCGHSFHVKCLNSWLKSNSCPVCRVVKKAEPERPAQAEPERPTQAEPERPNQAEPERPTQAVLVEASPATEDGSSMDEHLGRVLLLLMLSAFASGENE